MTETFFEMIDLKAFSRRLVDASIRKGYRTPTELHAAIKQLGFEMSMSGVQKHYYGSVVPNSEAALAYSKALDVSIEWLLIGTEPPLPDLLRNMLSVIQRARDEGLMPAADENVIELMNALKGLSPQQQKAVIDLARTLKEKEI